MHSNSPWGDWETERENEKKRKFQLTRSQRCVLIELDANLSLVFAKIPFTAIANAYSEKTNQSKHCVQMLFAPLNRMNSIIQHGLHTIHCSIRYSFLARFLSRLLICVCINKVVIYLHGVWVACVKMHSSMVLDSYFHVRQVNWVWQTLFAHFVCWWISFSVSQCISVFGESNQHPVVFYQLKRQITFEKSLFHN